VRQTINWHSSRQSIHRGTTWPTPSRSDNALSYAAIIPFECRAQRRFELMSGRTDESSSTGRYALLTVRAVPYRQPPLTLTVMAIKSLEHQDAHRPVKPACAGLAELLFAASAPGVWDTFLRVVLSDSRLGPSNIGFLLTVSGLRY